MSSREIALLKIAVLAFVFLVFTGGGVYIMHLQSRISSLEIAPGAPQKDQIINQRTQDFVSQTAPVVTQGIADPWATTSPSFASGLTDDISEYSFRCGDYKSFTGSASGLCQGLADDAIVSQKNYPGDYGAAERTRQSIMYYSKLIAADKELNSEYKKALGYFNDRMREYKTSSTVFGFSGPLYAASLEKTLPMFVESEKAWIIARDRDCTINANTQPPITWGTMNMAHFTTLECTYEATLRRTEFIKGVNRWLEMSSETPFR